MMNNKNKYYLIFAFTAIIGVTIYGSLQLRSKNMYIYQKILVERGN